MRSFAVTAVLGVALLVSDKSLAQTGPVFDCAKAEHEIELLICGDAELQARDRAMNEVYQQALAALKQVDAGGPETISELRATQRGWIGGRNDCWKADDKRRCALDAYEQRTAYLQARYFLIEGGEPVFYRCDDNSEIAATFIRTDPPSVRLERGDSLEVGILSPSGSGSRYDADFGVYFWTKGDEAQVAWPQDKEFSCAKRE